MIGTFRHKGLKHLFQKDDPSGVRADQAARIRDVLAHLDLAETPTDLDLPGYRLHALKGDLKGYWSVTISGNWRMVFRFEDRNAFDVDLVDYH
jgi:proteic killer suppression protein